jgi:hypothetical protein
VKKIEAVETCGQGDKAGALCQVSTGELADELKAKQGVEGVVRTGVLCIDCAVRGSYATVNS